MATPSLVLQSGNKAFQDRINHVLGASQTFTTNLICGISNSTFGGGAGLALPFNSANIGGGYIAFAIGRFDAGAFAAGATGYGPVITPSSGTESADITNGSFYMVNGTSGNAITQAMIGQPVYTADGATANATAASNPLPGTGTGTGVLLGTVVSVNQKGNGLVLVQVVESLNAVIAQIQGLYVASTSGGSPTTQIQIAG